jgi:hypothetical protein
MQDLFCYNAFAFTLAGQTGSNNNNIPRTGELGHELFTRAVHGLGDAQTAKKTILRSSRSHSPPI